MITILLFFDLEFFPIFPLASSAKKDYNWYALLYIMQYFRPFAILAFTALAATVITVQQLPRLESLMADSTRSDLQIPIEKVRAPGETVTWDELADVIDALSEETQASIEREAEFLARLEQLEAENALLREQLGNLEIGDSDRMVSDTVAQIQDAVVSISVQREFLFRNGGGNPFFPTSEDDAGETRNVIIGGGSGFLFSADGYILTNRHVVSGASDSYFVRFANGTEVPAEVIARDRYQDIAVLKIDPEAIDFDITPLQFGTSSEIRVGQRVIAIGNALAEFENTVTTGVISALGRNIIASDGMRGMEEISNLLQTDAAINPGNSGGPLVDIHGKVIGMNTAVAGGAQGIGFAIPVDELRFVAESVLKNGEIVRPFIGIRYIIITPENAASLGVETEYGAMVSTGPNGEPAVIAGSPAEAAGIQEGDIILEIDGERVSKEQDIRSLVSTKQIGESITLLVRGDFEDREVEIELQRLQ